MSGFKSPRPQVQALQQLQRRIHCSERNLKKEKDFEFQAEQAHQPDQTRDYGMGGHVVSLHNYAGDS